MCRYVCPYRVRKDTCQVDLALLCYAILLWRGCFVSLVCKSVQSVLAALDSINYIILVMSGCFVLRHKEKWPVIVQPQWEDALFYGMGGTTGITRESRVQEIKQIQKVKTETNWAGKTRVHSGHSFDGEHCCCVKVCSTAEICFLSSPGYETIQNQHSFHWIGKSLKTSTYQ